MIKNYESELWGRNARKLKEMKIKYDPEHRFNCRQCMGYIDPNLEDPTRGFIHTTETTTISNAMQSVNSLSIHRPVVFKSSSNFVKKSFLMVLTFFFM